MRWAGVRDGEESGGSGSVGAQTQEKVGGEEEAERGGGGRERGGEEKDGGRRGEGVTQVLLQWVGLCANLPWGLPSSVALSVLCLLQGGMLR